MIDRTDPLVVREAATKYEALADVDVPPLAKLSIDPVEILLEDRKSRE
jgi:hypothetical protein